MIETVQEQSLPTKKKWGIFSVIVGILILLFLIGGIPRLLNTREIDALAAEVDPPRVTLMKIEPNTNPIELVLPSSAQAWHHTPIWSRVNGYIVRYLVDIGDKVKKGDLLAEIDTPETDEQLAQAKADLLNATVERDIAKITSDRWEKLWEKNRESVSKQEVDQYKANLESAEAIVVVNEKNVSRYTYEQQFKFIYAPFDGVITNRTIDIGSLIYGSVNSTPQELYQIVQTDTIRFYVYVPQTYYTEIHEGLEAKVSVIQLPGKVFKGTVTRYAKALDPTARTMLTEVDVDNTEGLLYAGLYGTVTFSMKPKDQNFTIPTTAVIIRSSLPQVAVVDKDNIVHLKNVQIGHDYGNKMEIIYGLQKEDRIITIPTDSIHDGIMVEPIEAAP